MKLNTYADDALVKLLSELSAAATPGNWNPDPKRLTIPLRNGMTAEGPLMSYLVGGAHTAAGMTVSLGSERVADHRFVAALVNAWRDGRLYVLPEVPARSSERDCRK